MANLKRIAFPVVFLVLCVAGLTRLGIWQMDRMHQKEEMATHLSMLRSLPPVTADGLTPDHAGRRVHLHGTYDHSREVLLENQRKANDVGYRILTPLLLPTGQEVLVDRGWVNRSLGAQDFLAPYRSGGMDDAVNGVVMPYPLYKNFWGGPVTGVGPEGTTVLLKLEPSIIPLKDGTPRLPVYVQADGGTFHNVHAFLEDLPSPARHREYMYTWFALAAVVAALGTWWVALQLGRKD